MAWRSNRRKAAEDQSPQPDEDVIDLRDPLPPGPVIFGLPTRCPACEDMGYIDHINLNGGVMKLHCPTCHHHWAITEKQIEAAEAQAQVDARAAESAPNVPSANAEPF